jgi:cardiolipin synthase
VHLPDLITNVLGNSLWPHLLTVAGFLLAVFVLARLLGEKRAPANTFAWLLLVVLVPEVGVPLYLLLGGRKLRRLARNKSRVLPVLPAAAVSPALCAGSPVAHTIVSAGAAPPVAGNTVRLLTTGEETFAALEEKIRAARHTIHITTFILGRDDTGRRLVALLAERARAGVKVRLLLDAVGCVFSSRGFTQPLRDAGGEVGRFMPVLPFSSRGSANLRLHRKIAVFDHCTAMVGGHNLAREYMGPSPYAKRFRDFGALIEGPAAALLNEVFIADWCFATRQPAAALQADIPPDVVELRGASELQVVASGPDVPGDPLYEGIIAMIQEAEQSVCIVTPYFLPDEVLLRSLIVKARAGREVTVIVPARSNHPITDLARKDYLRQLRRAGARVLLFGPGMLHSKAIIVDGRIGLLGSANFDLRSLFVNFEIGVFLHSPSDVAAMKTWAEELARQSREPALERAGKFRPLGKLAEELGRLLAPFL